MCGDCCKGFGGTYVTHSDIKRIARHKHIRPQSLIKTYCVNSGNRLVLAQQKNGYCIFWDKVCTIHPVKPKMCEAWPFIRSVLIDVGNWHSMASMCPGMRTDVSDRDIRRCVRQNLKP